MLIEEKIFNISVCAKWSARTNITLVFYSNLEESLFASFLRVPKRVLRDVVLDLKQVLSYIMLTGKGLYLQIFSPYRLEYEKEDSNSHSNLQRCYLQNFCASTRIEENFTWHNSTGKDVHMQVCYPCRIECEKEKRVVVILI